MAKMTDIQSIFKSLEERGLIDHDSLSSKRKRVFKDIVRCRSRESGFHSDICEECGNRKIYYNSCKNPNCPKCQGIDRALWVDRQKYYALKIPYYHIVFTLPDTLNSLCLLSPSFMYDLLFECASKTLIELSSDQKYLGARIGFTAVLHTWGSNLCLHPHLHCIVTSGGMDSNEKWKSKKEFFLPVRVVSSLFKGKYLSLLKERFIPKDEDEFKRIVDEAYRKDWVVYIKEPLKNPDSVIKYLGRYTHRIAISNARIIAHKDDRVSFRYKDYKDDSKIKTMSLDELEFFRRYMMHITPKSFCRIRHYGLLSSAYKGKHFVRVQEATDTPKKESPYLRDPVSILNRYFKRDIRICECCGCFRHPLLE